MEANSLLQVITMVLRRGNDSATLNDPKLEADFVAMANIVLDDLVANKGTPPSPVHPFKTKDDILTDHLPYSDVPLSAWAKALLDGMSFQHARRTEDKAFKVSDGEQLVHQLNLNLIFYFSVQGDV